MKKTLTSIAVLLLSAAAVAQSPATLAPEDRSAIQALAASYARALAACDADAFADLFAPDTGYFASGFRGEITGRERLIALVESERHCIAAAGSPPPGRPGGANVPNVVVDVTPAGVSGVASLGAVGEYQDEYVKTPQGWRFASRTVLIPAEKNAGLDASEMRAIRRLSSGPELGDHYAPDANGTMRLRSSGVTLGVTDGRITGRAYLKDGSYYDDVYEQTAPGQWRIESRVHVPAAPEEPVGAVVGTGTFTSFVDNMDRSLAFYHDVFGMEVPPLPESGTRPYNPDNPQLFEMFDIHGARERHQSARVPGTGVRVEFMEVQDVEHRDVALRIQDAGSATLVLIVRDVDALLERVKLANVEVVTPRGEPVRRSDGARSVLIKDLDGRFVELRQPATLPEDTASADSNIVDLRLSIAVDDLARTTDVYRDVLGFTVEDDAASASDGDVRALTGLATAEVRRSRAQAPGSDLWIEFVEYGGVDRRPLQMRIQDRGAARLQVRAENVDQLVAKVKDAGLALAAPSGTAVPIPPNFKGALVADPNNFYLSLFAPCDGCAPSLRRATR